MKINFNSFWDILFPKKCLHCRRSGYYLCEDCFSLISINEKSFCPFCSRRTKNYGNCSRHQDKNLDYLHFATFYNQPLLKKVIKHYRKSPFIKELSVPLTRLIIAHFSLIYQPLNLKNILLIPFPISKKEEKFIGFSPSRKITKHLSKAFTLPFFDLIKISSTENFIINKPKIIKGKKIVLVKTIYHSGQSSNYLAKKLKEYGAEKVSVWAVARS